MKLNEANLAIQAQYLMSGYEQETLRTERAVTNKLLGRPDDYVPPYQDVHGHVGVAHRFVELSRIVCNVMEQERGKLMDIPGIFEYDVTEDLGIWFYDHSNCTNEEFSARLEARAKEFFGK